MYVVIIAFFCCYALSVVVINSAIQCIASLITVRGSNTQLQHWLRGWPLHRYLSRSTPTETIGIRGAEDLSNG